MNELDWKRPALIGGLLAGILSAIPGFDLINIFCCCAWLLVGGAVAAKALINRTPRQVKGGEGAQVGAIAGLIASGVYWLVRLPLIVSGYGIRANKALFERVAEMSDNPDLQELMQKFIEQVEQAANQTSAQRLIGILPILFIGSILAIGFSTLGGLLGIALFEKRKDQPPPQYPPSYPPQYPPQYPQGSAGPPGAGYPPQNPPAGPWSGDQGGQGGQGSQGNWPKE
ncbi:MAG TPA: hypothetical protein VIM99_14100 [Blastocatellia bacterium]